MAKRRLMKVLNERVLVELEDETKEGQLVMDENGIMYVSVPNVTIFVPYRNVIARPTDPISIFLPKNMCDVII